MADKYDRFIQRVDDAIEAINELKAEVSTRPKGMQRTLNAGEANAIRSKLERARSRVARARTAARAKKPAKVDSMIQLAGNSLQIASIAISAEVTEFNLELLRYQRLAKERQIWAQYEADAKRAHEKFMVVATTILEAIKKIPSLL